MRYFAQIIGRAEVLYKRVRLTRSLIELRDTAGRSSPTIEEAEAPDG
jgi:hypothetical protein